MTAPKDDAWLDQLLQDERHVDDAGFAARVTTALPPRRDRRRFGAREAAILGGAVCSAAVGLLVVDAGAIVAVLPRDLGGAAAAAAVVTLALWGAFGAAAEA